MKDNKNNNKVTIDMSKTETVDITFKNLEYTVKTTKGDKKILKGLDGICKSG